MDILDRLAIMGRRYERRRSLHSGSQELDLSEVLLMYNRKSIFERVTLPHDGEPTTSRQDTTKKLNLSLLDAISEIYVDDGGWYEVFETPPSGDTSKVRIVAYSPEGRPHGELRMVVGRRTRDHYFSEDPILDSLRNSPPAGAS